MSMKVKVLANLLSTILKGIYLGKTQRRKTNAEKLLRLYTI